MQAASWAINFSKPFSSSQL